MEVWSRTLDEHNIAHRTLSKPSNEMIHMIKVKVIRVVKVLRILTHGTETGRVFGACHIGIVGPN